MRSLQKNLEACGLNPIRIADSILVLPNGGRVIGLYPDGERNALWVNPVFDSTSSAADFLESPEWQNSGGARAWISPEAETNVGDLDRFWETYEVPHTMDPASYTVVAQDARSVTVKTDMELLFHRHDVIVPLELTRRISLTERSPADVPAGVAATGFRLDSTLSVAREVPDSIRPAIWNLTQVPGGGRFVIPLPKRVDANTESVVEAVINASVSPRACIGEPAYQIEQKHLICEVRAEVSFKFALKSTDCTGVSCYFLEGEDRSTLVVCRNTVLNGSLYSDYPADDPGDTGYVEQFYVDDGALGGFGEIEHHSVHIEPGKRNAIADTSEVTAYSGARESIDELLQRIVDMAREASFA